VTGATSLRLTPEWCTRLRLPPAWILLIDSLQRYERAVSFTTIPSAIYTNTTGQDLPPARKWAVAWMS
jgi:hypothetical protein